MGWADLLSASEERTLPWLGDAAILDRGRRWSLKGARPPEVGWHRFETSGGRTARWLGEGLADPDFEQGHTLLRGYLVGDRLIPDHASVKVSVDAIFEQTEQVWLVEPGLDRFVRALVARGSDGRLIYLRQEFPEGPELDVLEAWQDRADDIGHVPGVTPALELAFRWLSWQRLLAEERLAEQRRLAEEAAELERLQQEEAARVAAYQAAARDGQRRRVLAQQDFATAAQAALSVAGAELLDHREEYNDKQRRVVQFRFRRRRFECVVQADTLRIIDSGICLVDHTTGERGDERFTLESLPAVIGEAMDRGVLHVFRHVR